MDPYVFFVLEREAQQARVRAAAHTWHLHEVLAERTEVRRRRRHAMVRAILAMLRRHAPDTPVPASAGGRV